MRSIIIILIFFITVQVAAQDAMLQYLSETPVNKEMKVSLKIKQFVGGIELNTQGQELLSSQVTLKNRDGLPVQHPPFEITFVPRRLKVDLNVNNEIFSIDSDRPASSVYMAQITKLMGKPISFYIDQDRLIQTENEEFARLNQELPLLQEFNMGMFLTQMFQPEFALAGRQLKKGVKIAVTSSNPQSPETIKFKVIDVDEKKVTAAFAGKIPQKEIPLAGEVYFDEKHKENASLTLTGSVKGTIEWDRDNALKNTIKQEYHYQGTVKVGEHDWKIGVDLALHSYPANHVHSTSQ